MGKSVSIPVFVALCAVSLLITACGGGTTTQLAPNASPPPTSASTADFTLSIAPANVTLTQGGVPQSAVISVTPKSGFAGTVLMTISGLPPGVATNPAAHFRS